MSLRSQPREQRDLYKEKRELAYKPGSVEDNHSSRPDVTIRLKQPTQIQREPRHRISIWSCSEWGFPSPRTVTSRAVRSYRTISPLPSNPEISLGGILSVALSVGSRPPGITWHLALWSPDFPPRRSVATAAERLPGRLPCLLSRTGPDIDRSHQSFADNT